MKPEIFTALVHSLNASDMADELDTLGPLLERLWIAAKWQCYDHPMETEQGLLDAIEALEKYELE